MISQYLPMSSKVDRPLARVVLTPDVAALDELPDQLARGLLGDPEVLGEIDDRCAAGGG